MIGFKAYLDKHPNVAKQKSEKLATEGKFLFLKRNGYDCAIMPQNDITDRELWINITTLECDCNVFRTKKACPHVAAVLGQIERNDGKIPYTDPVAYVFSCLENLKAGTKTTRVYGKSLAEEFYDNVYPFFEQLPKDERIRLLMEMAKYMQASGCNLDPEVFTRCFSKMTDHNTVGTTIARTLFDNRHDLYMATAAVVSMGYRSPYSEKDKKTILTELAADDKIAAKTLPMLIMDFPNAFTRDQLLKCYKSLDQNHRRWSSEKILKRLEEEPPLYDEFLKIFDAEGTQSYKITPSFAGKMYDAGYAGKMGKVLTKLIDQIDKIDDYYEIVRYIPHELFLEYWRKREKRESWRWNKARNEVDIEITVREDPEKDLGDYNLDVLSNHLLGVIQICRPEYHKEVNKVARKNYRWAIQCNTRKTALDALMVLAMGDDAIAAKYASEWKISKDKMDDLVYIAAVGMRLNCMEKVAPGLKKMEVTHAAGQNQ